MKPDLPEETLELKAVVRSFVEKELFPLEEEHRIGPAPQEDLDKAARRAKASGLWLFDVPERFGGAELTMTSMCAVWEELFQSWAVPDRKVDVFGPEVGPIFFELTEEQQETYLQPLLQGTKRTCFAQTEPDAGSDPAGMRTRARRTDGGWVLNGNKRFITGADRADFVQVIAVAEESEGQPGGFTCFLVDAESPGFSVPGYSLTLSGEKAWEIVLDNVFVPDSAVAGQVGSGFRMAQKWLVRGRLRQASRAVAIAQRSMELTVSYAQQRVTRGKPLAKRQVIEHMLVDAHMELMAVRLSLYACAAAADRGEETRYDAAAVKIQAVEMASRVVDTAIQVHGGTGLMVDMPLARWCMDLRSRRITEGATEVMRSYIGRSLLDVYTR